MSQPISKEIGAKIHYHTVFECKTKCALSAVGFVGLTVLVAGILALLHMQGILDLGIGKISSEAIYSMLGTGGALILVDLAASIILAIKHFAIKKQMDSTLRSDLSKPSHGITGGPSIVKQTLQLTSATTPYSSFNVTPYATGSQFCAVAQWSKNTKVLHIFADQKSSDNYAKKVISNSCC